jgi:hypothetical protein
MMTRWSWLLALMVTGCAAKKTAPEETPGSPFTPPGAGVITLTARDGVELEADYYPQAEPAGGIVLLHMIPPSNDHTNWPSDFI